MRISKRLKLICELVTPNLAVADIGADHGLVEKFLIDNNITNKIVAIENKPGPYQILKNALIDYKEVRVSLSDGIDDIDDNTKILIIAGMGGINIVNILKKHPEKLQKIHQIIVDPHRDIELVKENIYQFGFRINKEIIIEDFNKKYDVISFIKE